MGANRFVALFHAPPLACGFVDHIMLVQQRICAVSVERQATTESASTMKMRGSKSQNGGMVQKRFVPKERRGKSAERSEKRETSTTKISRLKYAMVRSQNGGMVQKRFGP